ncbi:nucleolar protein 9 [Dendroctonus ponderosae]|uniref:Nucleolar protein 9 n=1 Tax=Dendroctonus ponderosae TaxID=77166 RepID=U4UCI4_DENPD|nr:nucleolar protein 9 [Dendroctonus ponderosae]ERL90018.1 hypothetical protein D910_07376 [Dendroctonus ponderosae]KAH1006122.1 hypothetical protein HUJ05_006887 [Dendroctonus ponderosae]
MSDEPQEKRKNRKRKKSFLKNARKYAKRGHFGRGSQIDEDTYQYFLRVMETFKQEALDEEEKAILVEQVLQQTIDKELDFACNQVGCRVLETVLPFAQDSALERFMEELGNDMRPLCSDRFAGFVLQALVAISAKKSLDSSTDPDKRLYYRKFLQKVSNFLSNNMEDFVWDGIGNHILRTCLCSLVQIPDEKKEQTKRPNIKDVKGEDVKKEEVVVPEDYRAIVKQIGERLIVWPQFEEMCHSELTAGLFQVLLKALKKADSKLMKSYLQKLLTEIFLKNQSGEEAKLPQGFLSSSMLVLLETALQVAEKKMFNQMCEQLFTGRMLQLASLRSTNFAVQKVIAQCSNKTQFDPLFDELADHFLEIIEKDNPAVLLAVCEACKRLSTKQGTFVRNMMKSLNCLEPEDRQQHFILCMCRLAPYDPKSPKAGLLKEKLSLQGTLMLQLMLEFNKPIALVNSLLNMDAQVLKELFSHSMGSHIVDSYTKSAFIGERSREKLVWKMKDTYQELAVSKYGSRAFEAIWNVANIKGKLQIMQELLHKEQLWCNSQFGKIIASKVNLALFKRNKETWKSAIEVKPEEA